MKIVVRADASSRIGSGHVMRCLTLAERLRSEGAEVLFVCRAHDGNLIDTIGQRGFAVASLPHPAAQGDLAGYAAWLGVSQEEDARDTIEAVAGHGWEKADWLIVDHYGLDAVWEAALRPMTGRILAIDDLANRKHDCDVLLDQNLVADFRHRYDGLLQEGALRLLGPKYALLQPDYAGYAASRPARKGPPRRILIFMGAADRGLTLQALQGFIALERGDLVCDVIAGAANPDRARLERLAADHANIRLHGPVPSLAPLMAEADLAIGAGGATSWERLCLGLRSIVVILAENQRPIAEELHRRGLVQLLGEAGDVTSEDFRRSIAAELDREVQAAEGPALVDGRGVDRVVAVMTVTRDTPFRLRPAVAADEALLLEWANDPATRANSFNTDPIAAEDHHRWFSARLARPESSRIYIAEADGVPLGQARFDLKDAVWVIDYSVAPEFRGRGLAARLLAEGASELAAVDGDATMVGWVLPGNEASHRVFRSLGYAARLGPDDVTRYEKRS
jgi:UDP-2,4-diacetamido-2,4,6-trideoxy-beta-L-altropyranose hydrolase